MRKHTTEDLFARLSGHQTVLGFMTVYEFYVTNCQLLAFCDSLWLFAKHALVILHLLYVSIFSIFHESESLLRAVDILTFKTR